MNAQEAREPERYFYHSFPRRWRKDETEIEKGLKILELIRDFGLLLTPEIVSWEYPHADGSPPRQMTMVQIRASFTELSPQELLGHAKEFGHFALEFEIDTLKEFFAIPVFYIPRGKENPLGQTMVIQLVDAMCVLDRMDKVKDFAENTSVPRQLFAFGFENRQKSFDLDIAEVRQSIAGFTQGTTPPGMLALALEGTLNYFYFADADESREKPILKYYRQREWRIAGNIGKNGQELMCPPSEALIVRLLELDNNFFGGTFPRRGINPTNPSSRNRPQHQRLIDWTLVLRGIDDRHIVGAARRVIVPKATVAEAASILSKLPNAPPVIAIEDV